MDGGIISLRLLALLHLMEQRMRDARRGETKVSEDVVRECESWTGWHQVREQAWKINQGDWRKPTSGVKREEREDRQHFANNETVV